METTFVIRVESESEDWNEKLDQALLQFCNEANGSITILERRESLD